MVDLLALVAGGAVGVLVGVAVLGIRRGSRRPLPAAPVRRRSAGPAPVPAGPVPGTGASPAGPDHAIRINRPGATPAPAATTPVAAAPALATGGPVVARLQVEDGGTTVALGDGPVTIGRGSDQALRVRDERASRAHAVVRARAKGGWELADAGSANGTLLNGHRIPDGRVAPLRDGDRIGIGGTTIAYHEDRGPAPTVRRPPSDPDATRIA